MKGLITCNALFSRIAQIGDPELSDLDENPLDDFETVRQRIEEEVQRQEAQRRSITSGRIHEPDLATA